MATVEPIVVGTDGSPAADRAVGWAASAAARRGLPLHIVHAVRRFPAGSRTSMNAADQPGDLVLAEAAAVAREGRPGLEVTTELSAQAPVVALRAHAGRAWEIVVGHRGHDGFTGLLLGSTALRAAGHIPGVVVVVRDEPPETRGEILVGIAGYDISWAALEYACEAAMTQKALLNVVEVWRVPAALREDTDSVLIRRALADARQRLREAVSPWREKYPDLEIRDQTVPGHPVGTLADRSGSADLLVVGSRGQSKVTSPFAGSVGHGLMHHAKCPVAVVRPRAMGPGPAWCADTTK